MSNLKDSILKTLSESANHSLGRVLFHTINSNIAVLTGHRGNLTVDENNRRNDELKQKIRDAGYGYLRVKGNYTENKDTPEEKKVKEDSLLVIGDRGRDDGKLLSMVKKWGEEYDQDSILHKSHDSEEAFLHGTSKLGTWPKYGEAKPMGKFHPNRISEFYSTLMGGKPFVFLREFVDLTKPNLVFISDQPNYWRSKERAEQLYNGLTPSNEMIEKEKSL